MSLSNFQLNQIEMLLETRLEFQVWKNSDDAASDFLKQYGRYGAAFFEHKEPPMEPDQCVYANSFQELVEKALKRWG